MLKQRAYSYRKCNFCQHAKKEELEELYVAHAQEMSMTAFYNDYVKPVAPEISYKSALGHFRGASTRGDKSVPHFDLKSFEKEKPEPEIRKDTILSLMRIANRKIKELEGDEEAIAKLKVNDILKMMKQAVELDQGEDKLEISKKELDDKNKATNALLETVRYSLQGGEKIKEFIDVTKSNSEQSDERGVSKLLTEGGEG